MGNWVFNAVTTIIGVVGVTVALVAYLQPRKRLRLAYQSMSTRYFAKEDYALPSEVVMTFNGEGVERLSRTTVIFWNVGTDVLRGEDIVRSDPLRVCLDADDRVLSHKVVGGSKDSNRAHVRQVDGAPHELSVDYDYLDPRDGFVVEIMHDGKRRRPAVRGVVKGLTNGPESQGTATDADPILSVSSRMIGAPPLPRHFFHAAAVVGAAVFVAGTAATCMHLLSDASRAWLSAFAGGLGDKLWPELAVAMIVIGGAYMVPSGLVIWARKRRYPRSLAKYLRTPADEETGR